MCLKKTTGEFITTCSAQIKRLRQELKAAEGVVIGAGAGLSVSSGMEYSGVRFKKYFSDFEEQYGFHDMYSGGFYPYETLEEYWAYWSRYIYINRFEAPIGKPYLDLLDIVKTKDYFVVTTNVDHQFQKAGFDKKRLFYTQGDYGLWQCSKPCHNKTYDNETKIRQMVAQQETGMRIPAGLVPYCPKCKRPMTMNLRCDDTFVQDQGFYEACKRYEAFLEYHKNGHILFLELGVGSNTPAIIKYPFWKMTGENPRAVYACINDGQAVCPLEIRERAICINKDIGAVLKELK